MYDNYETDARVIAGISDDQFEVIDENTMLVSVTFFNEDTDEESTVEFPFKWGVCGLCNGKGSHVNPSIDCNGISAQDFADDPYFRAAYMNGQYDQQCNECKGRTTVPTINESACDEEQQANLKLWRAYLEAEAAFAAESAWERQMGA